jgi:hypothetical protein
MERTKNVTFFILVGLLPSVLIGACGDDTSPGDQQTKPIEPMMVSVTVEGWNLGEMEFWSQLIPEVGGIISEAGEMSVTLPGSVSADALTHLFPDSPDYSFADYYWCWSGDVMCACSEGITVSPADARGMPVPGFISVEYGHSAGRFSRTRFIYQKSYPAHCGEGCDPGEVCIDDACSTQIWRVYADVATQVTGTCEIDDWSQTFDLDLAAGWNLVEVTSHPICLEYDVLAGTEHDALSECIDVFNSHTIKSISQTDVPWVLE